MLLAELLIELEARGVVIGNRWHSISSRVYEAAGVHPSDYLLDAVEVSSIRTLLIQRAQAQPVSNTDRRWHIVLQSFRSLIRRLKSKFVSRRDRGTSQLATKEESGSRGVKPLSAPDFNQTVGFVTPTLLSKYFEISLDDVMNAVDGALFELPTSFPLSRTELAAFMDEMESLTRELIRGKAVDEAWHVVSRMMHFGKRTSVVDLWFLHCEESRDAVRSDELRFLLESLNLFDSNALLRWSCVGYVTFGRDAIEPELTELLSDNKSETFRSNVVAEFRQRGFDPLQSRSAEPVNLQDKESRASKLFKEGKVDQALRLVWEVVTVMPGNSISSLGFKICRFTKDDGEAERLKAHLEFCGRFNDQARLDFVAVKVEIFGRGAVEADIDELLRGKPDNWRRHVANALKLTSSYPEREEEIAQLLDDGDIRLAIDKACELTEYAASSPLFLYVFEWCRENRAAAPAIKVKAAVEKVRPLTREELLVWTTTQIVCKEISEESEYISRLLDSASDEEGSRHALQSMVDAGLDVDRLASLMTSEESLKSVVSQAPDEERAEGVELQESVVTSRVSEMVELLKSLGIAQVRINGELHWNIRGEQVTQFWKAWRLHNLRFPVDESSPEGRGRISKYHKMEALRQLGLKRADVDALIDRLGLRRIDGEFLSQADSVRLLSDLSKVGSRQPQQAEPPLPPKEVTPKTTLVMDNVNYSDQNFTSCDFAGCSARNCNFTRANLELVNFAGAVLDGAIFSHANLSGAILDRASVVGADFSYVDLTRTSLKDVDLTTAKIDGASLLERKGNQ